MDDIICDIFENGCDDAEKALKLLLDYGQTDGAHHKLWVIDQAVRALAGRHYDELITEYKKGEDGPDTYEWNEGIAP